jgi:Domain of unknown function (DUF4326)
MTTEIVVVNMRKVGQLRGYRIDRKSPLGNPFVIGIHGTRDQVIEQYEKWIPWAIEHVLAVNQAWQELVEIAERTDGTLELACWCSPARCHGDVLAFMLMKELESRECGRIIGSRRKS